MNDMFDVAKKALYELSGQTLSELPKPVWDSICRDPAVTMRQMNQLQRMDWGPNLNESEISTAVLYALAAYNRLQQTPSRQADTRRPGGNDQAGALWMRRMIADVAVDQKAAELGKQWKPADLHLMPGLDDLLRPAMQMEWFLKRLRWNLVHECWNEVFPEHAYSSPDSLRITFTRQCKNPFPLCLFAFERARDLWNDTGLLVQSYVRLRRLVRDGAQVDSLADTQPLLASIFADIADLKAKQKHEAGRSYIHDLYRMWTSGMYGLW